MALSTWAWGEFQVNNFQEEFQEGCIEIAPDAGVPTRKVRFTDIQDLIQGTFTLNKTEYIAFLAWFKTTIKCGTIPFLYYDSRVEQARTVRIVGKPAITSNSNMYNITVQFAFDSNIVYMDRYLLVNATQKLLVNSEQPFIVTKKLRV